MKGATRQGVTTATIEYTGPLRLPHGKANVV